MSRLFLVRHAQASFLEHTYDKLSSLGESQSRLLGEFWARHQILFDRACSGPCVRQKDTAGIVGETYRKANVKFPGLSIATEFDQYQGEAVLQHSLPALVEYHSGIHSLHQALQTA